MLEPVQILWSPTGASMPSLGSRALVDVTDGDTPNVRMPIRMLSIDTPEITARSPEGAQNVDAKFAELTGWIEQGKAPISAGLAKYLLPRMVGGGSRQFRQGTEASTFAKRNIETRLARPNSTPRGIFIRLSDTPFDDNNRLLAYVAPDYSEAERKKLTRAQRSTFNLDMLASGWAAPFVIYPAVPGELDLPLLIESVDAARAGGKGIWADELTLLAYEYRALEKLHSVTKKVVAGQELRADELFSWRERYCADMRDRVLHGPEGYVDVPPEYRLWIWPRDLNQAIGRLNLTPSPALVVAG